ncbi:gamma-glutamyltransferase [Escherichia coli]
MLIRSKNGNTTAIDFREMAPAKATAICSWMIRATRTAKKSLTSHLASGTPGTVAGFSLALDKYGTMPLNEVVPPRLNWHAMVLSLTTRWLTISKPTVAKCCRITKTVKLSSGRSEPLKKGDTLVQADTAKSLEMIAETARTNSIKARLRRIRPGDAEKRWLDH